MVHDRGFTLVELVVALALTGAVAAAISSALVTGLRTYTRQIERAHVRGDLRTAMALFSSEFRGLDVAGSAGSDISEMAPSAITYRATRSTHFLCAMPNPATFTVTVWATVSSGLRQLDAGRDSLLLYAENDLMDPNDDEWIPVGLRSVSGRAVCPGGEAGLELALEGISMSDLGNVHNGAPVRGFQVTRILLYSAADGHYWVGLRESRPRAGWSITQPLLGPVSRAGLRFEYYQTDGEVAQTPYSISRIAVEVVRIGTQPTRYRVEPVRDSLTIHIGLRNNPRY